MATVTTGNISIYTISKEIGVSAATVSRALKNHPGISSAVRKKVRAAAQKYNYKPRFVRNRTLNICVLIQQYDQHPLDFGTFVSQILEGIAEYCRHEEVEMSVFSSYVHELNQCDVVRELRLRNADGAVILRATDQSGYISSLEDQQFPYFCLLTNDGTPSEKLFSIDEENLARTAVDYLVSLGHRRIGALANAPSSRACQLRLKGYRQALENNGIFFDPRLVLTADPALQRGGFQFGGEGVERLMEADSGLTAVFTTAEEIARGVLFRLNERQIKIPEEISVLGFDDFPGTAYTWPALTTVRIPYIAIGFEGARQVHRLMRGLPPLVTDEAREKIKGELIVRKTTGPETGHENK